MEQNAFQDISNLEIGQELGILNQDLIRQMNELLNDRSLFSVVKALTGVEKIGCFTGRFIKMLPGFSLDWHTDFFGNCLIGLSLNLGRASFKGGDFQIRFKGKDRDKDGDKDEDKEEILFERKNTRAGDAHIFLLGEDLEHRLKEVEGGSARYTFAGWFRSAPDFTHADYGPLLTECLED